MRALRLGLPPPRLAEPLDVGERLSDSGFEVGEVDRLGHEIECPAIHRGADIGHVAVGRHDHGRELVVGLLNFLQQGQTVHPGHVDIADHHVERGAVGQHFERFDAVTGKAKIEFTVPDLTAKPLLYERFQIRLVVDDEDRRGHASPPLPAPAAGIIAAGVIAAGIIAPGIIAPGNVTMNSVNAPGSVSTSKVPPCCLTTMSKLKDRPRPVPSPAGLVVKNGSKIFALTSLGIPVPLSRTRISTRSERARVDTESVGSNPGSRPLRWRSRTA